MHNGFLLPLPHFHFAERSLEHSVYNMQSCIVDGSLNTGRENLAARNIVTALKQIKRRHIQTVDDGLNTYTQSWEFLVLRQNFTASLTQVKKSCPSRRKFNKGDGRIDISRTNALSSVYRLLRRCPSNVLFVPCANFACFVTPQAYLNLEVFEFIRRPLRYQ